MRTLRTAIHVHTDYSPDSNQSPADVLAAAQREGIECLAITDHDEIAGAQSIADNGVVRVIIGEEVTTRDGHLIGLFLEERIPPGLSARETARRIHAQGGLVCAPHPFASLCDGSLGRTLRSLLPLLDAVEVFNAQNPLWWEDRRALRFAARHGLPGFGGADTHLRGRLAPCWQEIPDFNGPRGFLSALKAATLSPGRFGWSYVMQMGARHFYEKLTGRALPGYGVNARRHADDFYQQPQCRRPAVD